LLRARARTRPAGAAPRADLAARRRVRAPARRRHPQWFDAIDKDRNGKLTAMELQSALQLGGLNFSLATVAHIIR
jgi:Ca2+-binding EF-hand superfamily protein